MIVVSKDHAAMEGKRNARECPDFACPMGMFAYFMARA
jgi:hypothetical protein